MSRGEAGMDYPSPSSAASPQRTVAEWRRSGGFVSISPRSINEKQLWKKLHDAGLDEQSLRNKDKAYLISHVASLGKELYEYQYNMGLLLIDCKQWESSTDRLKASLSEVEEKLREEQASHASTRSESLKQKEALKKALGIERQCVVDLEKALREMRTESAELKVSCEKNLSEAQEMRTVAEEKILEAESKKYAGETLLAEANRKQADAERKLNEVEAREDALQREQQTFKYECEARENEIYIQNKNLQEWETRLKEGQEKLLDEQKLLNQKENHVQEKWEHAKQLEKDLRESKIIFEREMSELKEKDSQIKANLSALTTREEAIVREKVSISKKEQELLLLQEKLATREREMIQKLSDDNKAVLGKMVKDHEEKLEQQRIAVEAELENKKSTLDQREAAVESKEDKLDKRENQIEKRAKKLREKEDEVSLRSRSLKELEKKLKKDEKEFANRKEKLEVQEAKIRISENELSKLKASLEEEKSKIIEEQKKLESLDNEKQDLLNLQKMLKEEIDAFRAQQKDLLSEAEELDKEKMKFEKEWEILDEKKEQLKQEIEQIESEKKKVTMWHKNEEERLRKERASLQEEARSKDEKFLLEKEAFERRVQHEREEAFEAVQREREDLIRDLELRKSEIETSFEKKREELEKIYQEKEYAFEKKREKEMHSITEGRELLEKETQAIKLERISLEREKNEVATNRETTEKGWSDMKRDIEDLQMQREILKELRQSLHKEREEYQSQVKELRELRKMKDSLKEAEEVLGISEHYTMQENIKGCDADGMTQFQLNNRLLPSTKTFVTDSPVRCIANKSPETVATNSSPLVWFQKCASKIFRQPDTEHDCKKQESRSPSKCVSPNVKQNNCIGNGNVKESKQAKNLNRKEHNDVERIKLHRSEEKYMHNRRKRQYKNTLQDTSDRDSDASDIPSDKMVGVHQRKRQHKIHPVQEISVTKEKHYDFRVSTSDSMVPSTSASLECNKQDANTESIQKQLSKAANTLDEAHNQLENPNMNDQEMPSQALPITVHNQDNQLSKQNISMFTTGLKTVSSVAELEEDTLERDSREQRRADRNEDLSLSEAGLLSESDMNDGSCGSESDQGNEHEQEDED